MNFASNKENELTGNLDNLFGVGLFKLKLYVCVRACVRACVRVCV